MKTNAAAAARVKMVALTSCLAIFAGLLIGGCGGEAQDATHSTGTWKVSVEQWRFPKRQPLGTPVDMKLVIRNVDSRDLPHLAITIGGLAEPVAQQNAASRARPIWIINAVRGGDQTAYNSLTKRTFRLGPIAAGAVRTFTLPLTPLRRGEHVVSYSITADIYGAGKAETADGEPADGKRTIAIDPTPNIDRSAFN
ncbi:MAG: hypothetical protein JJE27_02065 [Thermoleophilia bacterium]|nr:hypothetical protein [Thermoleophilia bacterium]